MKQFTFRLTDDQVDHFELTKKRCLFKSSQSAFESMVESHLYMQNKISSLIEENQNLLDDMVKLSDRHDGQINLLMNVIANALKHPIVQQEQTMEY